MIETGDVLQKIDIEALSTQNKKSMAITTSTNNSSNNNYSNCNSNNSNNNNNCTVYKQGKRMQSPSLLPAVGPVVVITYKNHALDEFLIDLLDSKLWEG